MLTPNFINLTLQQTIYTHEPHHVIRYHSLAIGLHDIFRTKKNRKKGGEATKAITTSVIADKALDDIPFGLDI